MKEKITPCLWFDKQAQEAAALYTSLFPKAKTVAQSPIEIDLEMAGQRIMLIDGGPMFQPNASISLFYISESKDEIKKIWDAFAKDGEVLMPLNKYDWGEYYGWVNDRYGISWQLMAGKIEEVGQQFTPCLLFTGKQYGRAEEAIRHYSSVFKNVKEDGILRYGSHEAPEKEGTVKHAQIALEGQKFMFMDSAKHNLSFTEGVSLTIHCENQDEIDYYWSKLTEGGEESMCGWLKDKFGVSWQVIPTILAKMMSDPEKAGKAAQAFMQMRKFDIEKIVQAAM